MKQQSADDEKRALAEYLWLSFFNRTLRDKGMITQGEYQKMQGELLTREPLLQKQKSQSFEMEM